MKDFSVIKDFNDQGDNVKYASGEYLSVKKTASDNFLITIGDPHFIIQSEDAVYKHKVPNEINILVPKRRVDLVEKIKKLCATERYIFKMLRERRSGKFACSEVFFEP